MNPNPIPCLIALIIATGFVNATPVVAQTPGQALTLDEYAQFALMQPGDPVNGKALFRDEKRTKCVTCHVVGTKGGDVGPDLSRIGGKFDRPHLIESLLEPSKQIVEGYRTSVVVMVDGKTETGIVKTENERSLAIKLADGKLMDFQRDEIEETRTSRISLMPDNLADDLSQKEFADLIAYLETLRSGMDPGFGAGVSGPVKIVEGFQVETVVTNLSGATAMQPLADGRILICEQPGTLRILQDGKLLDEPMIQISVENNWERGLIGVTVHPNFPAEPYVYVCYVSGDPYPHHRISRFRVDGNVADPGSEQVLLRGDDQRNLGGHVPAGHQGGGMHFGNDGKLYVGIGEQTAGLPAQRLDTLQGKILRLNEDGSIPNDNPLLDQTEGKYQSIWAYGCRNPFTLAFQRSTGMLYINDVGGKFEEINRGEPGANYGWPTVEHGPTDRDGVVGPQHVYPEASISGGDFLSARIVEANSNWPRDWVGNYFFADFVHGWIKWIDPDQPETANEFAYGLRRPVDMRFGSDGSLYVLLRNAWVVDGKFEGGTGSLMRVFPTQR